MTANIRLIS
ncbi:hypothetical protein CGLO_10312 [Colletotrichum gloeosporioides Cg-14]|uniref:Uncharacterized protein n=1 Tax=Colletotrichum gloeosporioides (strain Cg-14) TaxID=1237896 RepID=T0K3R8_COLGC|nr:hypothetical protein CGLO_10312 [Colletotrichum gloeosporioides Cg-14]